MSYACLMNATASCSQLLTPLCPPAAPPLIHRFFNDARRINVALSRARHLSVVVGSAATMRRAAQHEPFWGSILRHYRAA